MAHALRYLMRRARRWRGQDGSEPTSSLKLSAHRVRLGLCLACLFLPRATDAQTPGAVPPVRFSVFSARPVTDLVFSPRANAAPLPLQFHPTTRSPRYEYRGAMPLRFLDAASGTVVAEAAVPAGMREVLLLFTPVDLVAARPGTLRYQIAVLDDSATRHGPGALAIVNLSGLALSGLVNAEKVTLKPGLNPTLAVGRSAKIALSTTFKNRLYHSYSSTVSLGPKDRALLILLPPFYAGALEVQSRLLLDQLPGPKS